MMLQKPPPPLPAFCDSCGNVFPSQYVFSGSVVELRDNIQQCPRCGGAAHIPDGIFNIVDGVIRVLSAPERTIDELRRLAEILTVARQAPHDSADIGKKIETELPTLEVLGQLLAEAKQATRLGYINLVFAAIPIILAARDSAKPPEPINAQQVIQQTYVTVQAPAKPPTVKKKKVGRNEPCPCGSGKKYKHCCGAPQEKGGAEVPKPR